MISGLVVRHLNKQWMVKGKIRKKKKGVMFAHNLLNLRPGQGSSCWSQSEKSTAFPDGKVRETQSSGLDDQDEATPDRGYLDG
jgi:hypothetical protein